MTIRRLLLVGSFLLAIASLFAPSLGFPIDFDGIIYRSVPLACSWAMLFAISVVKFRPQALWMIIGIPLALFWPASLVFNGIPLCYHQSGCR
jgi:hypothetical protein